MRGFTHLDSPRVSTNRNNATSSCPPAPRMEVLPANGATDTTHVVNPSNSIGFPTMNKGNQP